MLQAELKLGKPLARAPVVKAIFRVPSQLEAHSQLGDLGRRAQARDCSCRGRPGYHELSRGSCDACWRPRGSAGANAKPHRRCSERARHSSSSPLLALVIVARAGNASDAGQPLAVVGLCAADVVGLPIGTGAPTTPVANAGSALLDEVRRRSVCVDAAEAGDNWWLR
eukprot:4280355-Prymnesium_polylepis.2